MVTQYSTYSTYPSALGLISAAPLLPPLFPELPLSDFVVAVSGREKRGGGRDSAFARSTFRCPGSSLTLPSPRHDFSIFHPTSSIHSYELQTFFFFLF